MGAGDATADGATRIISMKEVQKHTQPDDAWLVYRSKVYDVSNWNDHPGGRVIFSHAGRDATDTFNGFHPASAHAAMEKYYLGELATEDYKVSAFEKDFQKLRAKIRAAGLFKASTPYYIFKCVTTLGIWALGALCLIYSAGSWPLVILGSCLIALFWQQSGWLVHDYMHHQIFKNRFHGDLAGYFLGNVCQGFSVAWWKDKHNTHHAIPNLMESHADAHNGDPDIDTMPILAWTMKTARRVLNMGPLPRFAIKNQATIYFPVLLVARLSWLMQSFTFAFRLSSAWNQAGHKAQPLPNKRLEHISLIMYYAWNLWLMLYLTPMQAFGYVMMSQTVCGLLLALAFGVGHNGMSTYEFNEAPEWGEWQITTTRNVHGSWLVGWFMGGLHHQIEHHLFPDVPRHNLGKLRSVVEPLCARHNIPYHSTTLWAGTIEVLSHLSRVTKDLMQEFPGL